MSENYERIISKIDLEEICNYCEYGDYIKSLLKEEIKDDNVVKSQTDFIKHYLKILLDK